MLLFLEFRYAFAATKQSTRRFGATTLWFIHPFCGGTRLAKIIQAAVRYFSHYYRHLDILSCVFEKVKILF
jgi:hypothetical protein